MKQHSEGNSASRRHLDAATDEIHATAVPSEPGRGGPQRMTARDSAPAFDMWAALDILARRWHWLLIAFLLFAGGFLMLGIRFIKPKFTANAQLLRYETPGERDFFTETMGSETFAALIRSPELLREVGQHAVPPLPPEKFVKIIKVEPDSESDIIKLQLAARHPQEAVDLLNTYASNSVEFVRQWYAQRAHVVASDYLKKEVEQMDKDIQVLDTQFRNLHLPPELNSKLAQVGGALSAISTNLSAPVSSPAAIFRQRERLDSAITELNDLLAKYTPIHPQVVAKREQIQDMQANLDRQVANAPTNNFFAVPTGGRPSTRPGEPGYNPEIDLVRMKLLALEQGRVNLAERHRQAEMFATKPPGIVRVFSAATLPTTQNNKRELKIAAVSVVGGFMGVFAALFLLMLVEVFDNRLRTADDVRRVTRLPVLTSLRNLKDMSPEDRAQWAFRTWTMLQGQLSPSANHGLVCGITSSETGEGRTTWIRLLAEAASLTGFRVLTIATKPSPTHMQLPDQSPETEQKGQANAATGSSDSKVPAKGPNGHDAGPNGSLTSSVLTSPSQVTEQLTGPNSQPVVHIPLPGWVWNLERRKQWGEALGQWKKIDNLVILVELPPGSVPEAVLLGSNLPNLLWLTNSGTAQAGKTRAQLETLRHARCNIVGAVLNRESAVPMKKRFPRWLGCLAVAAAFAVNSNAQITATEPQETLVPVSREPGFSIIKPNQRAAWQERLTLGPGDVLSFALYGAPELTRAEVAIGPDGRVSFLEAQDVVAAGLTIDELRNRLDEAIGKYRRAPRTILTPIAFRSKKYYVLGKVMTKGVYTLDRPLTVIEAIARAHGLENGLVDRNVIDLVDWQRSFLVRSGQRIPLNFEKLFLTGDLSQNIPVEPGDYLYFASADLKEVYVVGEVRLPGPVPYTPGMTLVAAITSRAGFTERAFKSRVLVVRGPLDHPERIAVDVEDITHARATAFLLKPGDIIFVNSRPFIRVEELADLAATAFLQSLITSWVGVDVVKPIPD